MNESDDLKITFLGELFMLCVFSGMMYFGYLQLCKTLDAPEVYVSTSTQKCVEIVHKGIEYDCVDNLNNYSGYSIVYVK